MLLIIFQVMSHSINLLKNKLKLFIVNCHLYFKLNKKLVSHFCVYIHLFHGALVSQISYVGDIGIGFEISDRMNIFVKNILFGIIQSYIT